jgi:hypothetical protein
MTRTLPHHLVSLLRACRELNTTETKPLVRHLQLSPATINVYFQRAAQLLGNGDRFSSVQEAFRLGLLLHNENNLLINGDFKEGHVGQALDASLPWTTMIGWSELKPSTPQWIYPEIEGEPPCVQMWGAADVGEAICQSLPPIQYLQKGHAYRFSAEYRFGPVRRDWPAVPRQPMFVDFVIRASRGALPSYTAPDEPGKIATLGRLHYAARPPETIQTPQAALTPERLEEIRRRGGEHAVEQELYTQRVGGCNLWAWECGVLEDWVADAPYDYLTIHPTNDLIVGTGGINPDAPQELAWGQIRRVRLVEVTLS